MKNLLFALLLCCAIPGLQAQDSPAGDAGADGAAATEAGAAGSLGNPDSQETEAADPDTVESELPEDPGALVEEDPAIAASAEEEFDPDEEISEDYPVPLPSDI